ncbi:MAG TPA: hypothetical protein GYA07_09915 [Verrucomicrobia bacterium]|nr:hypothetical protein [Verrucomicrobiota bacterium]HOP98473.1 hypothetical protein [Verrucomicrobiota bacterium]
MRYQAGAQAVKRFGQALVDAVVLVMMGIARGGGGDDWKKHKKSALAYWRIVCKRMQYS